MFIFQFKLNFIKLSSATMAQVSVMDLPGNGLHVIQGELSILLNSIRRPFKWSSQTYQVNFATVIYYNRWY